MTVRQTIAKTTLRSGSGKAARRRMSPVTSVAGLASDGRTLTYPPPSHLIITPHARGAAGSSHLRRLRSLIVLCLTLAQVLPMSARHDGTDSLRSEHFRPAQLIAPAALIAAGSFGVRNGWFCSVKQDVKDGFYNLRRDCRFHGDDYLQYLPVAANLGLGFVGAKARHSFRERVAVTATSYAVMGLMVNVTKWSVSERRPDSSADNSFPSGHTATAFMGAELIRAEYGNTYGAGAYVLATGIAVLRLYNDRHWLNDVLAGAGLGILSARVGLWLLPCERKLFRWDRSAAAVSVVPTYSPASHSLCISVAAGF